MKITHPLLTKSLGLLGAMAIRALTATLDYRIVYADPLVDPVHPRRPRAAIYVLWHEYLICPLGVRGKRSSRSMQVPKNQEPRTNNQGQIGQESGVRNQESGVKRLTPDPRLLTPGGRAMTVLISQHRDGELIAEALRHLGFGTVRGSSTRGGVGALRRMLRGRVVSGQWPVAGEEADGSCLATSHWPLATDLILAPDGPRGPRRRLAEGAIFLASRLQMPIVCMGFAFERPWRQKSWDHFAIPRPFSRARAVISGFIDIPSGVSSRVVSGPQVASG